METQIFKIESPCADAEALEQAGAIIRNGGLVAFPTETVYGLGGNALDAASSAKIFSAKGRPQDNPLIVHIADMEQLDVLCHDIPDAARSAGKRLLAGSSDHGFAKKGLSPRCNHRRA